MAIVPDLMITVSIAAQERRFRLLRVTSDLLLHALGLLNQHGDRVHFYLASGLPEDLEAVAICYEPDRDTFLFRVCSATFDPVEDCHAIPLIEPTVTAYDVPNPSLPATRGGEFL